eukprot:2272554-Pleurochrysis_carterae.AAC.1
MFKVFTSDSVQRERGVAHIPSPQALISSAKLRSEPCAPGQQPDMPVRLQTQAAVALGDESPTPAAAIPESPASLPPGGKAP